jgi:hypothetical protein
MKQMSEGDIVFVTDFKEILHLPLVKDQPSRQFYHNQQAAILAIVGIYCQSGIQKTVVFFFTSKILNKDNLFVREAMGQVFRMPFMKLFRRIFFMQDNARVFRSSTFAAEALGFETHLLGKECALAFFCQYHGKSVCDSCFGTLDNYLEKQKLYWDIIDYHDLWVILNKLVGPKLSIRETLYFFISFVYFAFTYCFFLLLFIILPSSFPLPLSFPLLSTFFFFFFLLSF